MNDTDRFQNNAFYPNAEGLFCFGGSDPPIDAKSWTKNCTKSFKAWANHFSPAVVDEASTMMVDPKIDETLPLPKGARPSCQKLYRAGCSFPYGVRMAATDITGKPIGNPPSIGAFEL